MYSLLLKDLSFKFYPHEVWLWLAELFQRRKTVKRTTGHGHHISSPFEPLTQVSYKAIVMLVKFNVSRFLLKFFSNRN